MAEQSNPEEAPAKPKVLVIEDDADLLYVLVPRLRAAGFVVDSAQDGEAGLGKAQSFGPDVVLLDLVMPRMDGWDVCRQLRKIPWTRDIPVVFITGLRQIRFLSGLRAFGPSRVVVKPFDANRLIEVLKKSIA